MLSGPDAMFGVGHIDVAPILYGIIVFLGIWSMWHKITHGKYLAFLVEVSVFVLVFMMHGGSMTGGMAAAVAALIAGTVLPRTLR